MSSEYSLNGVDLDQPGKWRVMEGTLLPAVPSPRLESTDVPFRSGIIDGAGLKVGTFKVTVAFMVEGADRAGLDRNFQALMARLRASNKLATLQHHPAGVSPREALVRLVSVSQPSWRYGEWVIDTTVVFEAVEGVWRDTTTIETQLDDLSRLAGGAAPISDAVLKLKPTANTVTIKDVTSGTSLTWRGTMESDQRLLVDVGKYSAWRQVSERWYPLQGAFNASAEISMSPEGLQLTPNHEGKIILQVTGATGAIQARRAY
jgi:hypothetical protein|uniref:Tail protein n=2 Tax=unclassified Caudoviricetes TaxID=2788787 RepID=A0A8S5PPW0_9CAUD|nr:MAG TPA: tail protein [Siphoviridae sp. ctdoa10]DAE08808.1 MAG TPA: tail protein [Siphoviridae sp. ctAiL5]